MEGGGRGGNGRGVGGGGTGETSKKGYSKYEWHHLYVFSISFQPVTNYCLF